MIFDWADFLLNPTPLRSIFLGESPSLKDIDLHEVVVDRDGPRVSLRFDLKEFVEKPPKKWVSQGFNKIQLQISAIDVSNFRMFGANVKMLADIEIYNCEGLFFIRVSGEGFRIKLKSKFLNLDKISGYCDSL